MTAALEGGEWSAARPVRTLPPGKSQYPFYRRLGGPQGRSGRAENLVPTGIRSRTVQPVVSRYTDWAARPTISFYCVDPFLRLLDTIPVFIRAYSLSSAVCPRTNHYILLIYFIFTNWLCSFYAIYCLGMVNPLTPNDLYISPTAPLTSKRCILYIYSTNVGTEYFKHTQYSPFFSLQNAVCFIMLTCLVLYYSHFIYRVC